MISSIKEICFFMIIAQGILYFVPGDSYMKYVRILVGVLMILRLMTPFLNLITNTDISREINWKIAQLEQSIEWEQQEFELEDREMGIYSSIEEALKEQLLKCEGNYEIKKVELMGDEAKSMAEGADQSLGDHLQIAITVARREENMQESKADYAEVIIEKITIGGENEMTQGQEENLRQQYSTCIGVNPENVEIIFQ